MRRNAELKKGCFHRGTAFFNDDLYIGICLQTLRGLKFGDEPCIYSHPPAEGERLVQLRRSRGRHLSRCGCPLAHHSLKTQHGLLTARRVHLECCAKGEAWARQHGIEPHEYRAKLHGTNITSRMEPKHLAKAWRALSHIPDSVCGTKDI